MKAGFSFRVHSGGPTGPRTATLVTPRGEVSTPAFMPVGTAATVKAVSPEEVRTSGARLILANTYHMMVRPGSQVVRRLGGLHTFSGWDGPIREESFPPADLLAADEAFLTGTTRAVQPILSVDETQMGDGRRGPVTYKLMQAFAAAEARLVANKNHGATSS